MNAAQPFWRGVSHGRLRAHTEEKLAEVENVLLDHTKSDVALLGTAAEYLIRAGGKRFRPALTLIAAQFGDPGAPGVVKAAAAVELTHLATLHHDDVMDEARVRRGVRSVNARWGNRVAVRSGDFLLARAAQLVADLGEETVRAQESVLGRLVRGQALELQGPPEGGDPVRHHLEVIREKTGSLMATAARFGAQLSGADRRTVLLLGAFGEQIGVAFRLADDLLDIGGGRAYFGKVVGADLRQGVPSLPVLLLKSSPAASGDVAGLRLRELLGGDLDDAERRGEALRLMRRHPVVAATRRQARRRAELARQLLGGLPVGAARSALEDLCGLVTDRVT